MPVSASSNEHFSFSLVLLTISNHSLFPSAIRFHYFHIICLTMAVGTPTESTFQEVLREQNDEIELPTRTNAVSSALAPASASTTHSRLASIQPRKHAYFHSRRIKKGEAQRPWLDKKDPREKWVTIIPLLGILVGLILSGIIVYDGLQTVQQNSYCPIFEVDFATGTLDPKIWTKEVEVGGFGYVTVCS